MKKKTKRRLVTILACLVVFATAYALMLPAITADPGAASKEAGFFLETANMSDDTLSAEVAHANVPDDSALHEEDTAYPAETVQTVADTGTETAVTGPEERDEVLTQDETDVPELSAKMDDYTVRVCAAKSVLSEGTTLEVKTATEEAEEILANDDSFSERALTVLQAFRLIYRDKDGKEVFPAGNVTVTVAADTIADEDLMVVRLSEKVQNTEVLSAKDVVVDTEKNEVQFDTDSFDGDIPSEGVRFCYALIQKADAETDMPGNEAEKIALQDAKEDISGIEISDESGRMSESEQYNETVDMSEIEQQNENDAVSETGQQDELGDTTETTQQDEADDETGTVQQNEADDEAGTVRQDEADGTAEPAQQDETDAAVVETDTQARPVSLLDWLKKNVFRATESGTLSGKGVEQDLADIANITLTKLAYSNVGRDSDLELGFGFTVKESYVALAKENYPWVYDLSEIVGSNKAISDIIDNESGHLVDGSRQTGTYKIENNKVYIYPDQDYLNAVSDSIRGTFSLEAELNENHNYDKDKETLEFPGGATTTVYYEQKTLNHSKTVGSAASNISSTDGDLNVVENADGTYSLFYRINVNPNSKLTTLKITDTLSGGQTLKADTVKLYKGSTDSEPYTIPGGALTASGSGFTLDVAEAIGNAGESITAWTNYYVTYETVITKETLNQAIQNHSSIDNEAVYDWDGSDLTDTTRITPKFEEKLDTGKYVGGSEGNVSSTSGNIEVTEESGNYYLYYRVTAKPNTKVDYLAVTDTVGAGQEIDPNSIRVTANGSEVSADILTVDGQVISGTIRPDGGIAANAEYVLTYRVKLTKNDASDAGVLGTEKTNHAIWSWKGGNEPNDTTVTPYKPVPRVDIDKRTSPTTAQPGETLTYTITINKEGKDVQGYTFSDYIANYVEALSKDQIVIKRGDEDVSETFRAYITLGTRPDTKGETYKLFNFTFPEGTVDKNTYTITYTLRVSDDAGLTGVRTMENTGWIGPNSSGSTYTNVDYGTSTIEKKFGSFDDAKDEMIWNLTVTIPEGKTLNNVVITESNFSGGDNQWYLGEPHTILWDELIVKDSDGNDVTGYTVDQTNNTITFPTLSTSLNITLRTRMPEGKHLNDYENYYVQNSASLKIDGNDSGDTYDSAKHEKADYQFLKDGTFDAQTSTATWTVTLNPDAKTFPEGQDIIPYFYDKIPEGMVLDGAAITINVDGHGNTNSYGNLLWTNSVEYNVGDVLTEIGPVNLVEAVRAGWDPQYAPTGLSGMTYTVTYKTRLTDEKQAEVEATIGKYEFINQAKIYDGDGNLLKTTSDTVEYEYKNLVRKYDITGEAHNADVDQIKYRIVVNENAAELNHGNPLIMSDRIGTDVTLLTNTIKVYADKEGDTLLDAGKYTVSYDDNSRKLEVHLQDSTYARIEFDVTPNGGTKAYTNTVTLKAGEYTSSDSVEQYHVTSSAGTLRGHEGIVRINKFDLYDVTKPLKGAEFALYRVTLDENNKITGSTQVTFESNSGVYKTADNGQVELRPVIAMTQASEEKYLYYWMETKAPDTYQITDDTPHYFITYMVYGTSSFAEDDTFSFSALPQSVQTYVAAAYPEKDYWNNQNQAVKWSELEASDKQAVIEYLNKQSQEATYKLDDDVSKANGITVASIADGYTWSVANVQSEANATLKGSKTMAGRAMVADEFAFDLYDATDPDNLIWLQTVRNEAGEDGEKKDYTFRPLTYITPGTYTYVIKERYAVSKDTAVVYDTSEYTVTVTVTQDDIDHKRAILDDAIIYKKNGKNAAQADFLNKTNDASISIIKTFGGSYTKTQDFEKSGLKDRLTFTIRDEDGNIIKTIKYRDMEGGSYFLKDGIVSGKRYTVEETYADLEGVTCTKTYTVNSVPGTGASATAVVDKAVEFAFHNDYEAAQTSIRIKKKWYQLSNHDLPEPGNIKQVYIKLQKYIGPESEVDDLATVNPMENWRYIDEDFEIAGNQTDLSPTYAVRAPLWTLEIDGLPAGRYRVVEVEKSGKSWHAVSTANVHYEIYNDENTDIVDHALGNGEKRTDPDVASRLYGPGVTDDSTPIIIDNKLVDIKFVKIWQDENGTVHTADDLGVQSVTMQLQSTTDSTGAGGWSDVAGKIVTLPNADGATDAEKMTAVFKNVTQRNEEGQGLFYRVIETEIILKDGTVLNTPELIAERFNKRDEKVISNETVYNYMHPVDGEAYRSATVTNTEKPFGISVTKRWEGTKPDSVNEVYFKIQAYMYGTFVDITDSNIKADDGTAPDADGIYKLTYDDQSETWSTLTFNYLFRKNSEGAVTDKAIYNWAEISAVRFVEVKKEGDNWVQYGDADHYALYTFKNTGENEETDAENGISPLQIGTYIITNRERKPTDLRVAKNWIGSHSDTRIYYKVIAIASDGSEQELSAADLNQIDSGTPTNVKSESSNTVYYLDYKDSAWETAAFRIPKQVSFGGASKYVNKVYVIETDASGNQKQDTENLSVIYPYSCDMYQIADVRRDNPIPAGSDGTLTITNGSPDDVIQPKFTKKWKSGAQEVVWPSAVSSVTVQLWRKAGESAAPEKIDNTVTITHSTVLPYTWGKQQRYYTDDNGVRQEYIYYVEEVSMTLRQNGVLKILTGEELDNWFAEPENSETSVTGRFTTQTEKASDDKAVITNKAPEEEKTQILVTKTWLDSDGNRKSFVEGETITFRVMSKTDTEENATQVSVSDADVSSKYGTDDVSTESGSITLTGTATRWPVAVIDLPKYRDGEELRYYIEELSAKDAEGRDLSYTVSYLLNGEPKTAPKDAMTGDGGQIMLMNRLRQVKDIEVQKVWGDTIGHAQEKVNVQLYRSTESTEDPLKTINVTFRVLFTDEKYKGSAGEYTAESNWNMYLSSLDWHNDTWSERYSYQLEDSGFNKTTAEKMLTSVRVYDENGDRITYSFNTGGSNFVDGAGYAVYGSGVSGTMNEWNSGTYQFIPPDTDTIITILVGDKEGLQNPGSASLLRRRTQAVTSGNSGTTVAVSAPDDLPAGAEEVGSAVTLNDGTNGWIYRWSDLPIADDSGNELFYYVAETSVDNTTASAMTTTYKYIYSDGTESSDIEPGKDIVKVVVTNTPTYPESTNANLKIVKVDADNQLTALTGARFQMAKLSSADVYEKFVNPGFEEEDSGTGAKQNTGSFEITSAEGTTISGLEPGTYKLTEVLAPAGYVVTDKEVIFKVSNDGSIEYDNGSELVTYTSSTQDGLTGVLTVGNLEGRTLPGTGSSGTAVFRMIGLLLCIIAALMYGRVLYRRRR